MIQRISIQCNKLVMDISHVFGVHFICQCNRFYQPSTTWPKMESTVRVKMYIHSYIFMVLHNI